MTCQVFVGEEISSNYQKYRFRVPDEVRDTFLQFFDEKVGSWSKICNSDFWQKLAINNSNKCFWPELIKS